MQIAEGDEQAFSQLYEFYAPQLRAYILKMSRSDETSQEIIQETFIRVWLNRDMLPEIGSFSPWLTTIAARLCFNFLEKTFNRKRLDKNIQEENVPITPEETMNVQEISMIIQQVINALPGHKRTVYGLHREQGLKPAAIAEQLNMPVGTVKNHLSAVNKLIRERLTALGYSFPLLILTILKIF